MARGWRYTNPVSSECIMDDVCHRHAFVLCDGFPAHLCILPILSDICFLLFSSLFIFFLSRFYFFIIIMPRLELCRCSPDIFLSSRLLTGLANNAYYITGYG